jgi:predicted signal transduction protein with EAL and GGDEF domain
MVMEHPFQLPAGGVIHITASIGVAAATHGEKLDALIARADNAMYLAKARGRNRCELHDGRLTSLSMPAAGHAPSPPELKLVGPRVRQSG